MTKKIRKMVVTTITLAAIMFGAFNVSATPATVVATIEEVPEFSDGMDCYESELTGELEEDFFSDGEEAYESMTGAIIRYIIILEEDDDPSVEIGKAIRHFENTADVDPAIGTSYTVSIEEDGTWVHELWAKTQKCVIKYTPGESEIYVTCTTF